MWGLPPHLWLWSLSSASAVLLISWLTQNAHTQSLLSVTFHPSIPFPCFPTQPGMGVEAETRRWWTKQNFWSNTPRNPSRTAALDGRNGRQHTPRHGAFSIFPEDLGAIAMMSAADAWEERSLHECERFILFTGERHILSVALSNC